MFLNLNELLFLLPLCIMDLSSDDPKNKLKLFVSTTKGKLDIAGQMCTTYNIFVKFKR